MASRQAGLCKCPTHLDLRIQEPQSERMRPCPMDSRLCSCSRFCQRAQTMTCMTRSCKPCFLSVRQMTLASAGDITVAAAFSCQAFYSETAPRNNSFSRPSRPCHGFSLDRADFARNASCSSSDTFARAFFNLDSISCFSSGKSSGTFPNFRDCFVVRRRHN